MTEGLREELLNPKQHNRARFSCGVPALDDYLQRFAVQQSDKGVAVVRVLVSEAAPEEVLGFYTLSAAQVDAETLPESVRKQLPRDPVPCFRMGRFAVSRKHQGLGLGATLLGCVVQRCVNAKRQIAAYALIVDAKDEAAARFYRHHGFAAFSDRSLALFLPI